MAKLDIPWETHTVLGRKIRGGSYEDQSIGTPHKIEEALRLHDWQTAADLAQYFVVEAKVCHDLYGQWLGDIREFLYSKEVAVEDLREAEERIIAILHLPDGTPWDRDRVWGEFNSLIAEFVGLAGTEQDEGRLIGLLNNFVSTWRRCHDRQVDQITGLMNEVVTRFGDEAIGPMYDHILVPWFKERYSEFDVDKHSWEDALKLNMMVAFEAMRGHLCGPGRMGDIEFSDLPDRYVLAFNPCGSGGRNVRGDEIEGTPPRTEAPYNWRLTQEPAPWNHFKPGVCLYCAHCIVLTEIMTIDAFGYPVRAVEPTRPGAVEEDGSAAKSRWIMFKDPANVPEEYYTRVGRTKPPAIGSIACGGEPRASSM